MHIFWAGLTALGVTYGFAMHEAAGGAEPAPWRLLLSALFFAAFFLSPLLRGKPVLLTVNLAAAALAANAALWPEPDGTANPYTLLVMSILAAKAVYRLPPQQAAAVGAAGLLGLSAPYVMEAPAHPPALIGLYAALHALALTAFRHYWKRAEELRGTNEALLGEYRRMKRRIASDEATARQEERAQVGRDIHDSVGHKLTALLMQLEVYRMQHSAESDEQLRKLKELAQESLQETRSAVKMLKNGEPGGLPAVIRLIRKLEAESLMKIHFTVRHGAMSAPLGNDQSIAVYRAVQEALTNAMKHGKSREVDVMFEAPGGSVFRFEVSNPGAPSAFREGFGLQSMRERMERNGGRLEVALQGGRFLVRGTLPLHADAKGEDAQ